MPTGKGGIYVACKPDRIVVVFAYRNHGYLALIFVYSLLDIGPAIFLPQIDYEIAFGILGRYKRVYVVAYLTVYIRVCNQYVPYRIAYVPFPACS